MCIDVSVKFRSFQSIYSSKMLLLIHCYYVLTSLFTKSIMELTFFLNYISNFSLLLSLKEPPNEAEMVNMRMIK